MLGRTTRHSEGGGGGEGGVEIFQAVNILLFMHVLCYVPVQLRKCIKNKPKLCDSVSCYKNHMTSGENINKSDATSRSRCSRWLAR